MPSRGAALRAHRLSLVAFPLAITALASASGSAHTQASATPNPFAGAAMKAFLRTRQGNITAAVYDFKTAQLFLYRPGVREDEASVAKLDILATRLYEDQRAHEPLSEDDADNAVAAIEDSDNDAAQDLWDADGGNAGLDAFNAAIGLRSTILDPAGEWGHNETTAADQVTLLEHLALPNAQLATASREYELALMRAVTPDQDWGVSAGVLAPASVALKNGWLAPGNETGWQINSVGLVSGRYRDYAIAVLTEANPSMLAGVQTIDGISQIVWKAFLPARFSPARSRRAHRRPGPPAPGSGRAARVDASDAR